MVKKEDETRMEEEERETVCSVLFTAGRSAGHYNINN